MQFERQAAPGDASRFYLFGGSNDAGWLEGHALALACHHTTSDSEELDLKCKLVKSTVAAATVLVRDYQIVIESVAGKLLGRRRLSEAEVQALIGS